MPQQQMIASARSCLTFIWRGDLTPALAARARFLAARVAAQEADPTSPWGTMSLIETALWPR